MLKNILITGASGLCGSVLSTGLKKLGYNIISCDLNSNPSTAAKSLRIFTNQKIKIIDLRNMKHVMRATKGVSAVIHFGGIPRHKPKEDNYKNIIDHNIIGTYNIFEASRINNVKRIIFASSAHVIGFHNRKNKLDETCELRPDSHYAVSKCFGETLSRLYADKYNIKSMSIRIGSALPKPTDHRFLSTWISFRDLIHLVDIGLKSKKLHCSSVFGVSKNKKSWWNNKEAYRLGYRPKDNAEKYINNKLTKNEYKNKTALKFHGGVFTTDKFNGNLKDILSKK